jgi:hypothetical protein
MCNTLSGHHQVQGTDDDQVILQIVHEVAKRAREVLPLIRRSVAQRAGAPDTGLAPGTR